MPSEEGTEYETRPLRKFYMQRSSPFTIPWEWTPMEPTEKVTLLAAIIGEFLINIIPAHQHHPVTGRLSKHTFQKLLVELLCEKAL